MQTSTILWWAGGIILVVLVFGYVMYGNSRPSQEDTTATTTVETTTTATTTATSTATTTTIKATGVVKPTTAKKMRASDFQLFVAAGYCEKVPHSSPLKGYKAYDFSPVTIAANQEAWKCSDGNYYTP